MEAGIGWNYIAMDQAIRDAGLEESDVVNERTGIIMGSGGPSTRAIVARRRYHAREGPQEGRPVRGAQGACARVPPPRSPRAFQIKGVNYSISSACATSAHCIGNAAEMIQWGKQDVMFAGGCEELDWTLSVLFDAMGAMSTKFNATPDEGEPRLRQEPRRLRHRRRRRRGGAGGAASGPRARGAKIYGEVVGYGATSDGFDMVAPSGEGAVRCMRSP